MAQSNSSSLPTSVDATTEDRATFSDSDLRVTAGWFNVPLRVVDLQVDLVVSSAAIMSAEVPPSRDFAVNSPRSASPEEAPVAPQAELQEV